jgi:hypothetical protein
MDAVRPVWKYKLPEATFRKLTSRPITRVDHGWRFLTSDTSESWITLITADNGSSDKGDTIKIASHNLSAFFELFQFKPDHARLFWLTYVGEGAQKQIAEIDKFERTYDRDRRDYERLKRKFEGGQT